ncbi:MAG: hypothetical protein OXL97_06695 [Chloroflexota bacterium]|nr:hypothetical protein [Chloroflexota bacterium]MDE2884109.1 hypothetical protein [Chloroflexota bacterium]
MSITPDVLAAALLRCPIGCAFLLTIARDGMPAALAVAPQQAFARAAVALRFLNPWITNFDEATAAVLARAPQLERLAHQVAAEPGAGWWTAPVDRERQVLLVDREPTDRSAPAPGWNWEDYAERPIDWRMTSTLRGGVSCGDVVIASGVGDWGDGPLVRSMAKVDGAARVWEVVTPADWHVLCASHQRVRSKPEPSPPPRSGWHYAPLGVQTEGPDRAGMLVPDWSALAAYLDGVHLTFAGLLTVPFVERTSGAGRTMMWSWDTEGTMWLQGAFLRAGEPLPPAPDGLDSDELVRHLDDAYVGIPHPGVPLRARRRRWWWPFGRR